MAKRSWSELVAEGKKLLKQEGDLKWHWGDLALEVEPMGDVPGARTGSYERLQKWAEEIGWSDHGREFTTLLRHRDVAKAWSAGMRIQGASFSVHSALRNHPDRAKVVKPGMSVNEARRIVGLKEAQRPPSPATVEQAREILANPRVVEAVMADPQIRHVVDESRPAEDRAEQARRLVRDPSVARHVVQDNRARSSMARAAKEMEEDSAQRQRERSPGIVGMSDFYQATGELSRARQALTKSLDAMRKVDLEDDQRESLNEDTGRVRLVLDWIDSYLESGDHSFDKELDALLREET